MALFKETAIRPAKPVVRRVFSAKPPIVAPPTVPNPAKALPKGIATKTKVAKEEAMSDYSTQFWGVFEDEVSKSMDKIAAAIAKLAAAPPQGDATANTQAQQAYSLSQPNVQALQKQQGQQMMSSLRTGPTQVKMPGLSGAQQPAPSTLPQMPNTK